MPPGAVRLHGECDRVSLDIHQQYQQRDRALQRLARAPLSQRNQQLIRSYCTAGEATGTCGPLRQVRTIDVLLQHAVFVRKDFDTVTRQDLERAIIVLREQPYAPATLGTVIAVLRRFYTWLANPAEFARGTPAPPLVAWLRAHVRHTGIYRTDLLTPADVQMVVRACPLARDRALITILWETGARIAEIGNLTLADVTRHARGYYIMVRGKTGTRSLLVVSAASALQEWLQFHPDAQRKDAPMWTPARESAPLRYAALRRIIRTRFTQAGMRKRVYPHLFRHSRATYLLAANLMNEAQVRAYFGWTPSSDMLAIYTHLIARDTDAAILRENNVAPDTGIPVAASELRELCAELERISAALRALATSPPR
jgi:integrase/recombinase XerD